MTSSVSDASVATKVTSDDGRVPNRKAQRAVADPFGALAIAGTITSQTALITGLLYYFGWVRAQATLAYFGLDTSLVGFSTTDYLLRSVNVAFAPFICVASGALLLLGLHRLVVQRMLNMIATSAARRTARWLVTAMSTLALALTAVVIFRMLFPDQVAWPSGLASPLLLVGSVGLLGYVAHLRSTHPEKLITTPASHTRIQALVLLAIGLLGALWAVSLYADQVGRQVATDIVADLPDGRPAVVIYSAERIALDGDGVEVAEITQPGSRYRYQYSGIRLFLRSGDKYLLLPVGWQRGHDRIFVVPDDDSIRVDIAAR
ncbi:MAG: hypothetical protein ACT4NP_11940 [Pseudonocardiales bacterium]